MATLEEAAQELVDKLERLDGEFHGAHDAFTQHLQDLTHLDASVAQDWNHLAEAVGSFLHKVEEQQRLLAQDGSEAANALGGLRGEVESVQTQAEAEIQGSREDVASLGEHLRTLVPGLDGLVHSGAEAPFVALREQATHVREQLEQALIEARDFLAQVEGELQTAAHAIQERAEALHTHITTECTAQLQSGFDTWQGHVEEIEDLVRSKLAELPGHAHDVVEYAMGECVTGHEQQLDHVVAVMPEIESALEQLKTIVDTTATDIGEEAFGAVNERLGNVSQAISRTSDALDGVRELLAAYTFVSM